jgi:hypothetical protein
LYLPIMKGNYNLSCEYYQTFCGVVFTNNER